MAEANQRRYQLVTGGLVVAVALWFLISGWFGKVQPLLADGNMAEVLAHVAGVLLQSAGVAGMLAALFWLVLETINVFATTVNGDGKEPASPGVFRTIRILRTAWSPSLALLVVAFLGWLIGGCLSECR